MGSGFLSWATPPCGIFRSLAETIALAHVRADPSRWLELELDVSFMMSFGDSEHGATDAAAAAPACASAKTPAPAVGPDGDQSGRAPTAAEARREVHRAMQSPYLPARANDHAREMALEIPPPEKQETPDLPNSRRRDDPVTGHAN